MVTTGMSPAAGHFLSALQQWWLQNTDESEQHCTQGLVTEDGLSSVASLYV